MKKTIKRLKEEKDSQSGIVAKFYALCRGFGEEYIESHAMGILERDAQLPEYISCVILIRVAAAAFL